MVVKKKKKKKKVKISQHDNQLLLTGVNYKQKENLFKQMKKSPAKFYGKSSLTSLENQTAGTSTNKRLKQLPNI